MERVSSQERHRRGRARPLCGAIAALSILILFVASIEGAESAFVRVNQLGYEMGVEGRAYLMAPGSESGAVFRVINSKGVTVFSSAIGAKLGTWGAFTVYALDFKISDTGAYRIDVDGPFSATSPGFRIGTPETLYSQGLANALNFYENERDGAQFIRTPLRTAAGHLQDEQAPSMTPLNSTATT